MRRTLVWLSLFTAGVSGVASAQPRFHFRILPSFDQKAGAYPWAINNHGVIVGQAPYPVGFNFLPHPFMYRDGEQWDLGIFDGDYEGVAFDVNDRGQAVGYSGYNPSKAVLWDVDASMFDLGTLGLTTVAEGINENGEVVGYSYLDREGRYHGFHWRDGVFTDMGTFGGMRSLAVAINNLGVAAGMAEFEDGLTHAFLWTEQDGLMDIGTFEEGTYPLVSDINDHNQVVGAVSYPLISLFLAIVWQDGQTTHLGTLGLESRATAINNRGQIVGYSFPPGRSDHAVYWEDGRIFDLNELIVPPRPDWVIHQAHDINEAGQIVGYAQTFSQDQYPVLLTPIPIQLDGPQPGRAGEINTWSVARATPGQRVYLVYGFGEGETSMPNCPGATILIHAPVVASSAVVDDAGRATIRRFVPQAAAGRTVWMQIAEPGTCQVSNPVSRTFN